MSFSLPQTHALPASQSSSARPATVTSVSTSTVTSTTISTVGPTDPTTPPSDSSSFFSLPSNPTNAPSPPDAGSAPGDGGSQGVVPPPTTGPQDSLASPLPTPPPGDSLAFSSETTSVDPFSVDPSSTFMLSTFLVASTDSTSGVHTYTKVTTIASFRSQPTSGHGRPGKSADGGSSVSQNVGVIVMCVMGGVIVCAIAFVSIWWCRRRRQRRRDNYEFTGYGSTTPGSPTLGQRLGGMFGRRSDELNVAPTTRFTISSFGNSTDRILTPTPFTERRSSEAVAEKPNPYAMARNVRFDGPFTDGDEAEGQPRLRNQGGPSTQRERPPTYVTNSTGIATIATTLPLYTAYDPSPISEASEPNTPTTLLTPLSPAYGRDKTRRSTARPRPLAPIGEKF